MQKPTISVECPARKAHTDEIELTTDRRYTVEQITNPLTPNCVKNINDKIVFMVSVKLKIQIYLITKIKNRLLLNPNEPQAIFMAAHKHILVEHEIVIFIAKLLQPLLQICQMTAGCVDERKQERVLHC